MPELVSITITDEESLFKACDILYDARFKYEDVDDTSGTELRMILKRGYFEDPTLYVKEKSGLFYRESHPLARTELVLSNLKSVKRKGSGAYPGVFIEVERRTDGYYLQAVPVSWVIEFDGEIKGYLQDKEVLLDEIQTRSGPSALGCFITLLFIAVVIVLAWHFAWW